MIEQESDVPAVWDGFGGGEVQCQWFRGIRAQLSTGWGALEYTARAQQELRGDTVSQ